MSMPILKVGKLRHREVEYLTQGHTASRWCGKVQTQDPESTLIFKLGLGPVVFVRMRELLSACLRTCCYSHGGSVSTAMTDPVRNLGRRVWRWGELRVPEQGLVKAQCSWQSLQLEG